MAHSEPASTGAPALTDDRDEFALIKQSVEKSDEQYCAERTTYAREEWWSEQENFPRDLWARLASQDPDGTDLADDEKLVAIRLFGWFVNDTDDWSSPRSGYGEVYGTATTLAVIKPAAESQKAADSDEWEYEPTLAGSRKAYRFERVKNQDGRWVTPRGGLYHPKAAGIKMVYPVGESTPVDQEAIKPADGYPVKDTDSDFEIPDRTAEWSYEDALEAARERVHQRQAKNEAEQITPLADLVDDRPTEVAALAISGASAGTRYLRNELDVEELSTADTNAIEMAAAETVDAIFKLVDEEDHDELLALLTSDDEDADGVEE